MVKKEESFEEYKELYYVDKLKEAQNIVSALIPDDEETTIKYRFVQYVQSVFDKIATPEVYLKKDWQTRKDKEEMNNRIKKVKDAPVYSEKKLKKFVKEVEQKFVEDSPIKWDKDKPEKKSNPIIDALGEDYKLVLEIDDVVRFKVIQPLEVFKRVAAKMTQLDYVYVRGDRTHKGYWKPK